MARASAALKLTASRMSFHKRGGIWVVVQSLMMAAALVLAVLFPEQLPRNAWVIVAGGALIFMGAIVGIAGALALKGNRTPFPRPREGSELIQSGIYSRIRHPLYLSVFLLCAGWSLVWGSLIASIVSIAMAPFFDAKARREERWLREMFPEYSSYEKQVARFVPWIY
jgi:protein-S-isoprenylcysteine O-methyltransferase Ste14